MTYGHEAPIEDPSHPSSGSAPRDVTFVSDDGGVTAEPRFLGNGGDVCAYALLAVLVLV